MSETQRLIDNHNAVSRILIESYESSIRHVEYMLLRSVSAPFKRKYKRQLSRLRRNLETAKRSIVE